MEKVLAILPHSIGGRLTTSSIIDGFIQNGYLVTIYDELKNENISNYFDDYKFIIGYDFSPIKIKIDNNLKYPCIAYFSDVIQLKTSGVGYLEYNQYLKQHDIFIFYWDRKLSQNEGWNYQPHFVNTNIYKNYAQPQVDVSFMGRFDTDLRLRTYLELNKRLPELKFNWYAIERHFKDALSRCLNQEEKNILINTYQGFIDNEIFMAKAINNTRIVYNINAQGVSSLNYRTFQVLACERLIISDFREELDLFDYDIPVYEDTEDLIEKIKFYINHDDEYKKITKKCSNIIKEKFNSKICVKKMLDYIPF